MQAPPDALSDVAYVCTLKGALATLAEKCGQFARARWRSSVRADVLLHVATAFPALSSPEKSDAGLRSDSPSLSCQCPYVRSPRCVSEPLEAPRAVAARRQPVETEKRVRKKSERHCFSVGRASRPRPPPNLSGLERAGNAVESHRQRITCFACKPVAKKVQKPKCLSGPLGLKKTGGLR